MSARQRTLERTRLELLERADVQRVHLRLQARALVMQRPWSWFAGRDALHRNAQVAGSMATLLASLLLRPPRAREQQPAWRVLRLALRCWAVGKLSWQIARRWRGEPRTARAVQSGTAA